MHRTEKCRLDRKLYSIFFSNPLLFHRTVLLNFVLLFQVVVLVLFFVFPKIHLCSFEMLLRLHGYKDCTRILKTNWSYQLTIASLFHLFVQLRKSAVSKTTKIVFFLVFFLLFKIGLSLNRTRQIQ